MRRPILAFFLSISAVFFCAQTVPLTAGEKAAIERGKKVLVSALDGSLPKVTLEAFLKSAADGASVEWEANDCGEQTGNPETDRGRDFPVCAEAIVKLRDGRRVNLSVAVGTVAKGASGKPELAYVTITDATGRARSVRLSELPSLMRSADSSKSTLVWPGLKAPNSDRAESPA